MASSQRLQTSRKRTRTNSRTFSVAGKGAGDYNTQSTDPGETITASSNVSAGPSEDVGGFLHTMGGVKMTPSAIKAFVTQKIEEKNF